MTLAKEVYEHTRADAQLDRERNLRLSVVREHIRQLGEQIFELSCQLQRQYELEDLRQALVLVEQWKALRAYQKRLSQKMSR